MHTQSEIATAGAFRMPITQLVAILSQMRVFLANNAELSCIFGKKRCKIKYMIVVFLHLK